MKQKIAFFLLSIHLLSAFPSSAFASDDISVTKKFIVTAYYSPLPDQSFYLRGSYEADLLLNGNGTHGASGKEVYPGMLAAPKTYDFGTRIYLEGLGIGTVDDRGGAIVWSGSRGYDADRLDMWMGQGEEGLKRALTWGKRTVSGKIIAEADDSIYNPLSLEDMKIAKINTEQYKKQENTTIVSTDLWIAASKKNSIFDQSITKKSDPAMIGNLQSVLTDLSYYNGPIDGKYTKSLEQAILDFQTENQLISSKRDFGAGIYGPRTRSKLSEIYTLYQENERKRKEEETRLSLEKAKEVQRVAQTRKEVTELVNSFWSPRDGEVGSHVRKLQQTLHKLGYFDGKDTAIFGKATRDALIRFQIDNKIVMDSKNAGVLGGDTKKEIVAEIIRLDSGTKQESRTLAWNTK